MTSGGHREKTKTEDLSEAMKWISNLEPDSWSWTAEESSLGSGSEFSPGSGAIWEAHNKQTQTAFLGASWQAVFQALEFLSHSLHSSLACSQLKAARSAFSCVLFTHVPHTCLTHMPHTCLTCLTLASHTHHTFLTHTPLMPHTCLTHRPHISLKHTPHMPHTCLNTCLIRTTHTHTHTHTHSACILPSLTRSPPALLRLSRLLLAPVFYWHSKIRYKKKALYIHWQIKFKICQASARKNQVNP